MDLGISGKVALVTAASKGLGRGAAEALAAEGCRVAICARDATTLERTAAELPGDVLAIPMDVTEPDAPSRLVAATVERFGGLDIAVTNVGGPPAARSLEIDDDEMHRQVDAHLLTPIRLIREALPHMRARSWGRVVVISSYVIREPALNLAYSNTVRTGLWAWAKTAARDLAEEEITINLVCPGPHTTDRMRELGLEGRAGDPADFGSIVAFLCSRQARFVSGIAMLVEGAGTAGLL